MKNMKISGSPYARYCDKNDVMGDIYKYNEVMTCLLTGMYSINFAATVASLKITYRLIFK